MNTDKKAWLMAGIGLFLSGCAALPVSNGPQAVFGAQQSAVVNGQVELALELGVSESVPAAVVSADCPASNFVEVQAHAANSAYPAPELSVTCTGTEVIIQTNNIPGFEFAQTTPNALQTQSITLSIPQNPAIAGTTTGVPLGGVSAVTVTGLLIFGPTEAPQAGYRDPYLDQILDYCNGHTAPGGTYHFHARPECLFEDAEGNPYQVIGYALDGFPILAPYVCADEACTTIVEVQSSWQEVDPNADNAWERHTYVAGSGDLDECNGATLADGSYAYFATDTFPYFMGCYVGAVGGGNATAGSATLPGGNQGQQQARPPGGPPPAN